MEEESTITKLPGCIKKHCAKLYLMKYIVKNRGLLIDLVVPYEVHFD